MPATQMSKQQPSSFLLMAVTVLALLGRSVDAAPIKQIKQTRAITKTFAFPTKYSLGRLIVLPEQFEGSIGENKTSQRAIGQVTVTIPNGYELMLDIGADAISHASELEKLPPDAFDIIKLSAVNVEDDGKSFSDQILSHVSHFTSLKRLLVSRSDASDRGLKVLKGLHNLQSIDAAMTATHGDFLESIVTPNQISHLVLNNVELNEGNLRYISGWSHLQELSLERTNITNQGLQYIGRCTSIRTLRLRTNPRISDDGITSLLSLNQLVKLDLRKSGITAKGISKLKSMKSLKFLTVSDSSITLPQLAKLQCELKGVSLTREHAANEADSYMQHLFRPISR